MNLLKLKKTFISILILVLSFSIFFPSYAFFNIPKKSKSKVKNVIVMISDGCGYNHVEATDYYQYGRSNSQAYEKFPVNIGMTTYALNGSYNTNLAWTDFNYVNKNATDSAAASTAMSTGLKTLSGLIGVDKNNNNFKNIIEYSEELGMSTGVITSVEFSHATPAGYVAHNESRNNYVEIANEMISESQLEVIMGAGNPYYDNDGKKLETPNSYKYVGGEDTWNGLLDKSLKVADSDNDGSYDPWTLVQNKKDFLQLCYGKTPKRVIGVPKVYQTLQQSRSGDALADPYEIPLTKSIPTLAQMTKGAINVLDNNKDGFFLMVEGGAVDWASHDNQSGRMIEEEIDFNDSVNEVIKWVYKNSNWNETVLIVTGDHECGYLTGPNSGVNNNNLYTKIVNNSKGNVPGMTWNSENHTNSLIPFYAKGSYISYKIKKYADEYDIKKGKYIDNTEIVKVLFDILE